MEAGVLGSWNAVLHWPFYYKNRAWIYCFPMAGTTSAGILSLFKNNQKTNRSDTQIIGDFQIDVLGVFVFQ